MHTMNWSPHRGSAKPAATGVGPASTLTDEARDFVRVWCIPLACSDQSLERLSALLDPEETRRACQFSSSLQHHGFVVAHGILRLILARYAHRDPRRISFCREPGGKPYLDGWPIHFSFSHTEDVALIAATFSGPVGVDVERIREGLLLEEFARDWSESEDIARIRSLPAQERQRAWFQAWTRFEALAKATGDGLLRRRARHDRSFRILDVNLGDLHAGAVAMVKSVQTVVYEAFSDVSVALARFDTA